MKTLIFAAIRCSLIFTAVAALSLAYPASVQAVPTTYHYTGNPFTDVSGPYTTSMFVTAMVTLADPLGANMPFTAVTPTAFKLFDGVQTLSNATPDLGIVDFRFATNARAEITNWIVNVFNGTFSQVIQTVFAPPTGFETSDTGVSEGRGINEFLPGVWGPGIATPDAGSTLSLMMLTLMALGLVARRFQRGAA